jgi:hypothetical protein
MNFSVIVPCHNPVPAYLEQALVSVMRQLDDTRNQLLLIDDGSDPPLIAPIGWRLIRLEDVGGCRATNMGYAQAQEELVHVLHPDDWVLDGFYQAIRGAAEAEPTAALYATQRLFADEDGVVRQAPRATWLHGPRKFQPLHHGNPLAVAACAVRRGFRWNETLVHSADWEMWVRLTHFHGACAVDWPLAVWRIHSGSHTTRLMQEADNLRDILRMGDIVSEYAPVQKLEFRAMLARIARSQERMYREKGELRWSEMNAAFAREMESSVPRRLVT